MTIKHLIKVSPAVLLVLNISMALGQEKSIKLSLAEAIQLSKSQNIAIKIANTDVKALNEDLQDAKKSVLPVITTNGSYQRFSKALLFTDGLGGTQSIVRMPGPNSADLSLNASFNVYSGGRTKAVIAEQKTRAELGMINSKDQQGQTVLQVVDQYLALVRQTDLQHIIAEQIRRAETRLKNINILYKNNKITRSDLLRAELTLSNTLLAKEQNDNNIDIAVKRLNVLLNLQDPVVIVPADSASSQKPELAMLNTLQDSLEMNAYAVRTTDKNIQIAQSKLKEVKSANAPSISLFSSYGFSYPNFLFYPPVDQLYGLGFVGAKISYNISSLYHNKHKINGTKIRIEELKLQKQNVTQNIQEELDSYIIKYKEALHRVEVMKKSIVQAQVNYNIVSTKYFNQLALLTDLLDADNLLNEARFNLVNAQTQSSLILYHILYTTGNI